ncbi:hypothetical protein [Chitinimonas sp.]|uniref:hypothetical protein n=1 Tax=Chitinimonas sp. TaxID=1934313 RepID=UPI002F93B0AD
MTQNIYAPPTAALQVEGDTTAMPFFVVSQRKLGMLYLLSFGLYHYYWSYKHWQAYRHNRQAKVWPLWRAIGMLFYTHDLYRVADQEARQRGIPLAWSPAWLASGYVLFSAACSVALVLSYLGYGRPYPLWFALACPPLLCAWLVPAQAAINRACADPQGLSNGKLSGANYCWIVPGCVLWSIILVALFIALFMRGAAAN